MVAVGLKGKKGGLVGSCKGSCNYCCCMAAFTLKLNFYSAIFAETN